MSASDLDPSLDDRLTDPDVDRARHQAPSDFHAQVTARVSEAPC